jgi:3D (Asp-Asp-Asp) domain-containing protein
VEKLALQRYPVDVIATGYTPRPEETSGDPLQCAWWLGFQGAPFNGRSVALSDDLLKTIPMGAYIWIEVQTKDGWEWLGRFQVRDRSPQDYPHVDIQMFSLRDAFRFGRRRARIYYLPESSYWDLYAGLLHDIRDPHMSVVEKFRLLGGDLTPIYD